MVRAGLGSLRNQAKQCSFAGAARPGAAATLEPGEIWPRWTGRGVRVDAFQPVLGSLSYRESCDVDLVKGSKGTAGPTFSAGGAEQGAVAR